RTQARIDSGRQPVIGVNKYRPDTLDEIEVLKVDNSRVRAEQIEKLRRLREERDEDAVQEALRRLTAAAAAESNGATLENNLLAHAVDAARAMATVGEISEAIEKVYGRHSGQIRTIQGVYREEAHNAEAARQAMDEVAAKVAEFEEAEGRRPRILVAKMGQDGHDRGQKVIATA
ncbi:methylmalonyl-CoA mutase, partial [Algoriphagus aestuarii]|nr:methylmalonyl-CoA mutase [Algoriphagus aestuarii]